MVTNSRFPYVAYWANKKFADNNQTIGANTKQIAFRCVESTLKRKASTSNTEGSTAQTVAITLRTDEQIAKLIEADDSVTYDKYIYSVVDVSEVRSIVALGAKEYLVALR